MIIECPECSSRFKVPEERLKPGGIKVRCSRCKHVFRTTGQEPVAPPLSRPAKKKKKKKPSPPASGGGKAALGRLEIKRARVNAPAAASPLAGGAADSGGGLFDREDPFASTQFGDMFDSPPEPEPEPEPAASMAVEIDPPDDPADSFSSLIQRNEADDVGGFSADPFEEADPFSREDPFASTQFSSMDEGIRQGPDASGLAPLPELDPIGSPGGGIARPSPRPPEASLPRDVSAPAPDDFLVDPARASTFQMPDQDAPMPGLGGSVGGLGDDEPTSSDAASTGVKVRAREEARRKPEPTAEAPFRPTGPVPRVTSATGGMVLPAAPQAQASDGGPLQMAANVLLIVLVLTMVFFAFVGLSNGGLIDLRELPAQIKSSFGQGAYDGRLLSAAAEPGTPQPKAPAVAVPKGLTVVNVRHTYFPNKEGQQLFLVEGGVLNQGDGAVREIKVQGKVLDGKGKVVASLTAPAGRTLSEEELLDVTAPDHLEGAYAQVSKEVEKMLVGPKKATNFTLVFLNLPPEAAASRSFEVEVAGYADKQ